MTCTEVESLLIDAGDGRLDLSRQMRLSTHLEGCAACRARAAEWRQLTPALRALVPDPLDVMRARRMQLEIERQLASARAPARVATRRWALAPATLMLAGATVVLAIWLRRPPIVDPAAPAAYATVLQVDGALSAGARTLAPAAALAEGSQVVLAGGRAELALGRGARLRLSGPARVVLGGTARDVALRLEQGTLDAEVVHRRADETFAVVTRDLRVEVRGTRFSVEAAPAGSRVRVDEGRVEVRLSDGRVRSVGAGETLAAAAPGGSARAPAPAGPPADLPAPGEAPAPQASAAPRSPAPLPNPSCAERIRGCEATARDARDHMRTGDRAAALHLLLAAREPPRGARGGAVCCVAAVACQDELGYLHAEALRGLGRIDDAIGAYRQLDRRGAPAAMRQNALYAAAQLERRRGHPARARADYQRALAASPRGALREEATLGAMDSAAEAGDRAGAEALARRYLDDFPAGLGAARARQIRDGGRP
jgi:ferric-dicitrate binding protein FerR (iron transport regulator)